MTIKNFATIPPENVRMTPVPLKIEAIKEYFENKQLFFAVNYSESQIQGNMFLTYISNLDLPCEILLDGASSEARKGLLKNYMESRNLAQSDVLRLGAAHILFRYREIDSTGFYPDPVLSEKEQDEFISENAELVRRWDQFLSSTLLYLVGLFPELEKQLGVSSQFEVLDDVGFVGSNIVQLFSIPSFLERFFSTENRQPLLYFKPQFNEYMFRGKNFFHYYFVPENTLALALTSVLSGAISPESFVNFAQPDRKTET